MPHGEASPPESAPTDSAARETAPVAVPEPAPPRPSVVAPAGISGERVGETIEARLARAAGEASICQRCRLCETRTKVVFGVGDPRARLMFIGEGPGADEDRQGVPFVGRAGELLTKMIRAMGFEREQVYIANIVKCRPPGNRDPKPDEVDACRGYLEEQIDAIRPAVIVALGRVAAQTLLGNDSPVGKLRGQWWQVRGIATRVTFHPAYLLRDEAQKKPAWEDLQIVRDRLRAEPGRS